MRFESRASYEIVENCEKIFWKRGSFSVGPILRRRQRLYRGNHAVFGIPTSGEDGANAIARLEFRNAPAG